MNNNASSSPAWAPRGERLILSVDVDIGVLYARHKLLEAAGYGVLSAVDGEQAMALFGCYPVDLVLMEYVLPNMDGDLAAEAMKETKPHVPIIMVSDAKVPEKSLDWVDRYVRKEDGPQVLLRAIRDLTRSGRERHLL
jgi:DNA-binding response OmpR family regulator